MLFEPTLEDQINDVKNEITMRRKVYPRLVANGKMTRDSMDFKIACMEKTLKSLYKEFENIP